MTTFLFEEGSRLLTTKEVSDRLNVTPATISQMAAGGMIPAFKFKGQWRFCPKELNDWAAKKRPRKLQECSTSGLAVKIGGVGSKSAVERLDAALGRQENP